MAYSPVTASCPGLFPRHPPYLCSAAGRLNFTSQSTFSFFSCLLSALGCAILLLLLSLSHIVYFAAPSDPDLDVTSSEKLIWTHMYLSTSGLAWLSSQSRRECVTAVTYQAGFHLLTCPNQSTGSSRQGPWYLCYCCSHT